MLLIVYVVGYLLTAFLWALYDNKAYKEYDSFGGCILLGSIVWPLTLTVICGLFIIRFARKIGT